MKSQWMEKLKEQALKKDNLIICILTGVLLLVIVWPIDTGGSSAAKTGESYNLWESGKAAGEASVLTIEKELTGEASGEGGVISDFYREESVVTASLEQRLEEMLSSMSGVGAVKVMITLSSSGEKIVEKDAPVVRSNTTENDSAGGSRSVSEMDAGQETIYVSDSEGNKIPYVVRETGPVIAGVSVSAEGGGNALVQNNITEVIQALFGIDVHKIKVVKMK